MKTAELTGAALNWAVAKCIGFTHQLKYYKEPKTLYRFGGNGKWCPSTDWSQGGPIIEREKLSVEWVDSERWLCGWYSGQTPLIAAMRCYVASQFGDEVDIPEELL